MNLLAKHLTVLYRHNIPLYPTCIVTTDKRRTENSCHYQMHYIYQCWPQQYKWYYSVGTASGDLNVGMNHLRWQQVSTQNFKTIASKGCSSLLHSRHIVIAGTGIQRCQLPHAPVIPPVFTQPFSSRVTQHIWLWGLDTTVARGFRIGISIL